MLMKILLIAFLIFFTAPVFGQKSCDLTLKDSPEIRGLKLEMSKQDVEKIILPSSGIKISNFSNTLTNSQLSKLKGFENVDSLDIMFLRESFDSDIYRVSTLVFRYKADNVKWDSVIEFAENISDKLKLPSESWKFSDYQGNMICKDFQITIFENYIRLQSTTFENELKKLREQKKKEFKP